MGIGGSELFPQHVMTDGCWSKLVDVVSGLPQGSVFEAVIVPSVHFGAFSRFGK